MADSMTTKKPRKRRASTYLAFVKQSMKELLTDVECPGDVYTLAAEGVSPEDCQKRCSEAGKEHLIVRLHLRAVPQQALLWGARRARKPKALPPSPDTPMPCGALNEGGQTP
jgi:hypothetical protein